MQHCGWISAEEGLGPQAAPGKAAMCFWREVSPDVPSSQVATMNYSTFEAVSVILKGVRVRARQTRGQTRT